MMSRFHCVYDKLNEALDGLMYQELAISEEVQEQVNSFSFYMYISVSHRTGTFRYGNADRKRGSIGHKNLVRRG